MRIEMWIMPIVCLALLCSCDRSSSKKAGNGGSSTAPVQSQVTTPMKTNWPLSLQDAQAFQRSEAKRVGVPCFPRLNIGDSVSIDLVFIPGGTFPMGSPSENGNPLHVVKISKGFLISKYEITWKQFMQISKSRNIDPSIKDRVEGPDYPATVLWMTANTFCGNLSIACGVKARLVTEAEWEYACRAGTTLPYGEWDSIDDTKANVSAWQTPEGKREYTNKKDFGFGSVGQYKPNRWGVHDMMGNVDEWCLDAYSDHIDIRTLPPVDPVATKAGGVFRVVRGGSSVSARTVFERTGDATSGGNRGIRLVIEIDDAIKAKLVETADKNDRRNQ
jgi:formylglycine-generating enzyme required for sulfatase activity